MTLILMLAPAISLSIFWIFEFPGGERGRLKVYKILPPWLLTVIIIVLIGSFVTGVLGPIAAFITDIVLSLVFILDKRYLEYKFERKGTKGIVFAIEDTYWNIRNFVRRIKK